MTSRRVCLRVRGVLLLGVECILQDLPGTLFVAYTSALLASRHMYPNSGFFYRDAYLHMFGAKNVDWIQRLSNAMEISRYTDFWAYLSRGQSHLSNVLANHPPGNAMHAPDTKINYQSDVFKQMSERTRRKTEDEKEFWAVATEYVDAYPLLVKSMFCELKRKIFITNLGFLGALPLDAQVGDEIAIVFGSQVPQLVRKDGDHFLNVGPCYVLGLEEGQAMVNIHESRVTDFYLW